MAVGVYDFAAEGGVRTISLHNIRYGLVWRGDKLFGVNGATEVQLGMVAPAGAPDRWNAACAGYLMESFPDKESAKAAVEAGAEEWAARFRELT